MNYGLIGNADKRALEETIDLIFRNTDSDTLNITEVGIFDGDTAKGRSEEHTSELQSH